MEKFEYKNERFSEKPRLWTDKTSREIRLSTLNEYFVLSLSKETNGGQFSIICNALTDLMPRTEQIIETMRDMACKLNGACFIGELKQGVVWDDSYEGRFREDPWFDNMPFEEWYSPKQIAKEFYGRKQRRQSVKVEDRIISLTDLLNTANLKIEGNNGKKI